MAVSIRIATWISLSPLTVNSRKLCFQDCSPCTPASQSSTPWCATQLEGSYIPLQALRQYDPVRVLHLHIDRGRGEHLQRMQIEDPVLSRAWWGGWVLLRAALFEKGITLTGPAPQTLVEPVSSEDLKQATLAILPGWAVPLLKHPAELAHRGYQSYTVLTLCRMLYTLENAAIASKPVAARWAQIRLGKPWAALIERAWAGRHDPQSVASTEDVESTLEFIRFTLAYSLKFQNHSNADRRI